MGENRAPAMSVWGTQTERSLETFQIGAECFRWPRPVIRAPGLLRKAAVLANLEGGELEAGKVGRIVRVAAEVITGKRESAFPLLAFQIRSRTETRMNADAVIANLPIQRAGGAALPERSTARPPGACTLLS
ncbi:MAG: lyase family protein [Acetobacteraceae bacterium]